jgi:hypothetical protein
MVISVPALKPFSNIINLKINFCKVKREMQEKRINLGNKGLTKLWAMNPDNLG